MAQQPFIFCERTGRWAAAARQALGETIHIRETRSREECEAALAETPTAWVLLEMRADNASLIAPWLVAAQRRWSGARFGILTVSEFTHLELELRDCGAACFFTTTRDLATAFRGTPGRLARHETDLR